MKITLNSLKSNWFFVLLTIILLIIITNQIFVNNLLSKKSDTIKPLIKVEYQRLLSQKIIVGFDKLQKNPALYDSILQMVHYYKVNHYTMLRGDENLMIKAIKNKECQKILSDASLNIEYINQIFDKYHLINEDLHEKITANQEAYLKSLNTIVFILQDNLNKELLAEENQLKMFSYFKISIILLLARFYIWPIYKRNKNESFKLFNSEKKLLSHYNSSNEFNMFIEPDYKICYFNKVALELYKNGFGNIIKEGDDFRDILLVGFENVMLDNFDKAIKGEIIEFDLEAELPKSKIKNWYHISFFPVYDSINKIIGVAIISRDIQEKMLVKAKNNSFTHKFELIAWQQSHLIRAHVANLLGLTNAIMKPGLCKSESDKDEMIVLINSETKRLDEVVHQIVKLSTSNELYHT